MPVTRSKINCSTPVKNTSTKRSSSKCNNSYSSLTKIPKVSVDVENHKLKVIFQNDHHSLPNGIDKLNEEDQDVVHDENINETDLGILNHDSSSSTELDSDSTTDIDDNIAEEIEANADKFLETFANITIDNNKNGISDGYFLRKSNRKNDSDKFFEVFDSLNLDEQKFITTVRDEYEQMVKELKINLKPDMSLYYQMLKNDFNLLFYGYGSKIPIMNHFIETYFHEHFYLTIRGYLPEITLKDVLIILNRTLGYGIDSMINNHEELFENLNIEFQDHDLFLFIHSIDRLIMQDKKNVMKPFLLNLLTQVSRIRLISSADLVNFEMQWTSNEMAELRLQTIPLNTYVPYLTERRAINGGQTMTSRSRSFQMSINYTSVCYVYESLNNNAKRIFVIILKHFVGKHHNSPQRTLKFDDLYRTCREEFLTSSATTIRQQLTEFKDHKLLKFKSGIDGGECISLCFDLEVARRFLNSIQDNDNDN